MFISTYLSSQSKFDSLDPELLNSQVAKYAKYVSQLEKGLPPNSVVPRLKEKVERMKEKVQNDYMKLLSDVFHVIFNFEMKNSDSVSLIMIIVSIIHQT